MVRKLTLIALVAAVGVSTGIVLPSLAGAEDRVFKAELSGASEVPPVVTSTTGSAKLKVAKDATRIDVTLKIRDASGILGAAGAHIHCAPEGTNGPVVAFLAGALPGGYTGDVKIDASIGQSNIVNTGTPCGATIADLAASFAAGLAYVNAHSPTFPGGEIRGQVTG